MKLSFNQIKKWTKFAGTPDEMRSAIDLHITEVEDISHIGRYGNMVVGKILEINPHPNADRLRLTKVDIGELVLDIVCGGKNIKVGQKVPVALPGAMVSAGHLIEESTIRGEKSQGMLCSAEELGMSDSVDGVMILEKDTEIGTPLNQIFDESGDVVFDLKVLANRADYMSYISLVREIAASLNLKFLPKLDTEYKESTKYKTKDELKVTVPNKTLVPRYTARVIKNVTIQSSPEWVQDVLAAAGIKPINNLVDFANYVMLETGQPIHVFDADKLKNKELAVRLARKGEKVMCLDDQERILSNEDIVIATGREVAAVAGIIGGLSTAVTEETKNIAIEVANFNRVSIRKSSRRLGIRTEASGRFERGVDLHLATLAMDRLVYLIKSDLPGCMVAKGALDISDNLPPHHTDKNFNLEQILKLIGIKITNSRIVQILNDLDLQSTIQGKSLTVKVPSYRSDIIGESDIAEEIIRIHGLDKIEAQKLATEVVAPQVDKALRIENQLKDLLSRFSMQEVYLHPFDVSTEADAVHLSNPLNANWTHLKSYLLPGLFKIESDINEYRIFEISTVFYRTKNSIGQNKHLAIAIKSPGAYREAKGVLLTLLATLGVEAKLSELTNVIGVEVHVGKNKIGELIATTEHLAGFEINLKSLEGLTLEEKQYVELPKFPPVKLDLAFLISPKVKIGEVYDTLLNIDPLVSKVELFDTFKVSDTETNIAFHLELRSNSQTLTGEERDRVTDLATKAIEKQFKATIRN